MKKILYCLLTVCMLCMNGCKKEEGFYVHTTNTTEFDNYAKETVGTYIYANYKGQSNSVKIGKGILVYGDNTYSQVIYPIWLHNTIVATYQVIQYNDTYMSNYSDEHAFYLNNFKNGSTSDLSLKIFKYGHELYYSYADTIYKSNGKEVKNIDIHSISFENGTSTNVKDTLGYLPFEEYNSVKLFAYAKNTSEFDEYAKKHFFSDLMFVNSSYELGRGITIDENRVMYPVWHNDSIVRTYFVSNYNGFSGNDAPYTYALEQTIGKTSIDNPLRAFHQREICYILKDKVYGSSSQKLKLIENFDMSTISTSPGTAINVRNTLKCTPTSNGNIDLYAYTTNTDNFDEYAKVSVSSDVISYYKYINNSFDIGKGIKVYGDTLPQVIYPLFRNNTVIGLYQVIEYEGSYFSNYFTVGERLFANAQNNNKIIQLYQLDGKLLYIVEDIVYEIDGINVNRLFDFDINALTFTDGEQVNVNEILEYQEFEY